MDDTNAPRTDADLETVLGDFDAEHLELLDPPEEVWEGIEAATGTTAGLPDEVVPRESGRRARRAVLGFAAALVLAAAGVAGHLLTREDPAVVVATAALAYDPQNFDALGAHARAGADLTNDDGRHSIVIVDAALPSPEAGADLEVWLIKPDEEGNVADLVSLGVVDPANPGSLEVPTGCDPGAYFVVDISVEPRDGDPTHSGRSILRGQLQDS